MKDSLFRSACAAALTTIGAAAALATPAAAQSRIQGAGAAQVIVLGETAAANCYDYAVRGEATRTALGICATALRDTVNQQDLIASYVNRAILYSMRGEHETALADLAQARARAPNFAAVHLNEGGVLLELGRWPAAQTAFDRALALETAQPHVAQFGRAIALEEQGDIRGAYDAYQAAAALAPEWELPRLELERFRVEPAGDDETSAGS